MIFQSQTSLKFLETQKQFLSVMFTLGSNSESINLGNNHSNSDRQWVDNQSSIIGTESVDIDVKGKLGMEGSLIANINKDGKDVGNLDIKAGSIETSDINNFDRNSESGYDIDRRTGASNTGSNDGKADGYLNMGIKNEGSIKEGTTNATIGQGNIEVADGSDISEINRDIGNANIITRDQITGALDGKLMLTGSWADSGWTSPNTALGLLLGGAGVPFGAEMHYDKEKGIAYFYNHPLGIGGMSLGDVVFFFEAKDKEGNSIKYDFEGAYNQIYPTYDFMNRYNKGETHFPTKDDLIILGKHEDTHTLEQSRKFGPLYLPIYFGSGGMTHWNWMEKNSDKNGNNEYKNFWENR